MEEIIFGQTKCYIISSEKYLQINDATDSIKQDWDKIRTAYPDFHVAFSFTTHRTSAIQLDIPLKFLQQIGAKLVDDCVEIRLSKQDFKAYDTEKVFPVTKNNFSDFAKRHDQLEPDMYWNSQRIKETLPAWTIFVSADKSYIMARLNDELPEIYDLQAPNPQTQKNLLSALAKITFDKGKSQLLFMVDRKENLSALTEIGFQAKGYYQCWTI